MKIKKIRGKNNLNNSKNFLTNRTKIFLSILMISLGVFLISGIYAIATNSGNPATGFNIHVSVNKHDHANLDAQYDHYCKLTPPIVATCLLFAKGKSGNQILSEVEYIITREQYLQLPFRDRQNWHNHAVELTPERGSPQCISLPEGLECGALVSILHQTYGKVVNLWDPSDSLPSHLPYNFLVDSPYALKQDLNNNLHKEWKVGDASTSSAGILHPTPEEDEDCKDSNENFKISYSVENSGSIVQLGDFSNFGSEVVDSFNGKVKFKEGSISGNGEIRVDAMNVNGKKFILNVKRFKPVRLLEHDCDSITWRNTGSGNLIERGGGGDSRSIDFKMDVTYNLVTKKIDAIAIDDDKVVVFNFKDMIDIAG
ncbi:MAG: DUF1264 domain-containing protein [Nanoarchaeota archaeon]